MSYATAVRGCMAAMAFCAVQAFGVCPDFQTVALFDTQWKNASATGSCSGGEYTLSGTGHDFWWSVDRGAFAWLPTPEGDFSFSARIKSPSDCVGSKFGLSVRQSPTPGSPALTVVFDGNSMDWNYNSHPLGTSNQGEKIGFVNNKFTGITSVNAYLKIERKDGKYSTYISENGTTWITGHKGIDLPGVTTAGTVAIGLAMSCPASVATSIYDNISCSFCHSAKMSPGSRRQAPAGLAVTGGKDAVLIKSAYPFRYVNLISLQGQIVRSVVLSSASDATSIDVSDIASKVAIAEVIAVDGARRAAPLAGSTW